MTTLSLSYADYGSGPLAEIIGWINWGTTLLDIGTTLTGITVPLENGLTLTFDISNTTVLGDGYILNPTTVPSIGSPFGTLAYTGISGNTVYQIFADYPVQSTTSVALSNIRVTNSHGFAVSNYAFAISNIETATDTVTPIAESQIYRTDGANWNLLTWVGDTSNPIYSGVGTKLVTTIGNYSDPTTSTGAPVLTTEDPTKLTIDITSALGIQALTLGIYILPSAAKRGVNLFKGKF